VFKFFFGRGLDKNLDFSPIIGSITEAGLDGDAAAGLQYLEAKFVGIAHAEPPLRQ
jgi:hypothetical protein